MQLSSGHKIAGLSLLAALGLWFPAFLSPLATGLSDWQFFHHMWEAGYVALTRHGEWPLWDPYHCGGITIFGNPESQHLSPLYLLAILATPTFGSKLFVLVHAAAGFGGMYLLARKQGLLLPGSLLATLVWSASGFFASHGARGHITFMPFYLTPWVLLAWRAAALDVRHALSVAGLLVLVLLEGGVYPFPYLVLLLAFDAGVRLVKREQVRGVVIAGVVSAVLTALIGAIRVVPIIDELRRNPRTMPSHDGVSIVEVIEMLTRRKHGWHYEGHPFAWHEYLSYVGWGSVVLGILGVMLAVHSGRKRLALGLLLFLGLTMGDHGELSPWSLVHRLPIYDSLRVPSRFAVYLTLYLGLLAGMALDFLHSRWTASGFVRQHARAAAASYLVCAMIALDLAIVHFPTLDHWTEPPIITDAVSERFYLTTASYGRYCASLPRMNLGTRDCFEGMSFTPAEGLWSGDEPQARIVRGVGAVKHFARTTRRVFIDVLMQEPGRMLVNQNHAPGWQSDVGEVVTDRGLLALELPSGRQRITLLYTPTTLTLSIVLSLLGLSLGCVWWRWGASWIASPPSAGKCVDVWASSRARGSAGSTRDSDHHSLTPSNAARNSSTHVD